MRRPRRRFSVGRLMVVIAGVSLVLGGVILSLRPQAIELRPHPLPTRVNVDHAIFDVEKERSQRAIAAQLRSWTTNP